MDARIKLIQDCINNTAARGCTSYRFLEVYTPDFIDHLFRYFMEKGYKVSYTSTRNPNKILITVSW